MAQWRVKHKITHFRKLELKFTGHGDCICSIRYEERKMRSILRRVFCTIFCFLCFRCPHIAPIVIVSVPVRETRKVRNSILLYLKTWKSLKVPSGKRFFCILLQLVHFLLSLIYNRFLHQCSGSMQSRSQIRRIWTFLGLLDPYSDPNPNSYPFINKQNNEDTPWKKLRTKKKKKPEFLIY